MHVRYVRADALRGAIYAPPYTLYARRRGLVVRGSGLNGQWFDGPLVPLVPDPAMSSWVWIAFVDWVQPFIEIGETFCVLHESCQGRRRAVELTFDVWFSIVWYCIV